MKKTLLIAAAVSLLTIGEAYADNGRTAFMVVTDANGQQIAKVELGNKDDFKGPVFDPTARTLTINGVKYSTADIGEIRFTYGEATTGIESVTVGNGRTADSGVYNLQGVRVADKLGKDLPKGVYIVGGRKVVVK